MFNTIYKKTDISSPHIVFYINSKNSFGGLSFLKLTPNIEKDIKRRLRGKESSNSEYFLGGVKVKKLTVLVSKETTEISRANFLGKSLREISEDICIISEDSEDVLELTRLSVLSRYSFQKYKTKKNQRKTQILSSSNIKDDLSFLKGELENIILARELGETPACDLTPEAFCKIVKETKFKNIKVKVLNYKAIQKKGLGLIGGVGKGSDNKPCLVVLEHIIDKNLPVHGIIGKGVTFDTGGNQIKPGDYMYDMKGDMGGAAVTYALMKELDRKHVKKNFVACLALAENVVSSNAYKPSDILTGYTGKTVEVIHTDAEGRLVLADGMSYVGKNYKTTTMTTIATLTGAVMVALGFRYAGIMGNNRKMLDKILEYSKTNTEQYVELPLDDYLIEKTKSKIADFNNLDRTVHAGSSMGAAFLSNFLENNEKYVHIDIAGTYINEGEPYGKIPKGMTGFGVESLSRIFAD